MATEKFIHFVQVRCEFKAIVSFEDDDRWLARLEGEAHTVG